MKCGKKSAIVPKNVLSFDNELPYNGKYLKRKVKSYEGKIHTNFHNYKIPREASQCICLSVILIDSVYRKGKKYYPQVLVNTANMFLKKKDA